MFESSGLEQLVGDDDTTPLNQFNPQAFYRQLARPIGRLAVEFKSGNPAYCTAALVSDDLILTNAHCIFDASGNNLARAGVLWMGYLSAGVKEGTDQYEVATSSPIEFGTPGPEGPPDYVILRVKSGDPGKTWGTVQLSNDAPLDGDSLAIMHHPLGFPMVVSAGGQCRSTRLSQIDVFHICDTQGGSSGAPVFALGSSEVVAIHYRKVGLSENAALRIDHLLDASPLLRGIVAAYGRDPSLIPEATFSATSRVPLARPQSLVQRVAQAQQTVARQTVLTVGDYKKGWDAYDNGDYAAALREWRPLAEQGNARAQANLGVMYENGLGVTQDDAEAVRWYRLAAEQGDAWAQFNLGVMYENGRGVTQDDAEAVRWYRLAAEQGDAKAQYNLGNMYRTGLGVPQDDAEAVRWYRLAAEQGNARAQANLGVMYKNGRGVTQDDAEAVRLYRLAAEQGDAWAQTNLGVMYENGRGVTQDDAEAVRWFRLAAEQGHADAQYNLGWMYDTGRGVPQDDAEAVRWFRLAAEQGNAWAQKRLDAMLKSE